VSWKIYQDLVGSTFNPDFGDGTSNSFAGNFTDNPVLYFNQYANATTSSPLFQNACTGTQISNTIPSTGAPEAAWLSWAEQLFDQFKSDVNGGKLPQVSWLIAPAGYCEHPDWPSNYGAWHIAQTLGVLVSNPEVWSKTVLLINYDENDGGFDHLVSPMGARRRSGELSGPRRSGRGPLEDPYHSAARSSSGMVAARLALKPGARP
jgi:phospholipase C